jgi:streptogramin lyase
LETVDDPQGLTGQVGGPAMVTANENVCCNAGSPFNGRIYWNPATNLFKYYPVQCCGNQFTIDVNRSTPSAGPPTLGGGDTWTSSPMVHFRGSNLFRYWSIGVNAGMGVRVNPANGKVYVANTIAGGSAAIFEFDPATNQFKKWATGSSPWFLVLDGNFVYATAATGAGYPDQILRLDVTTNTLTRWNLHPGSFLTANQVGIFNFITQDAEGQVWFTQTASNEVGQLNPLTNALEEFSKPGITGPSGIASTGLGPTHQTFFNDMNSNNVGLLASALATPTSTTIVVPTVETVVPSTGIGTTTDLTVTPVISTITPQTATSQSVDPSGIFLFPVPGPAFSPTGMTRVVFPETVFGSLTGSGHVFQFTSASVLPAAPGKVTGGGFITVPNGAATFGFNVQRQVSGGPVSGELEYQNHATDENVHSVAITSLVIAGNTASFGGSCTNNGAPCTFSVTVQDNGEPGIDKDTFQIEGAVITPAAGVLRGGNIQIHQTP